MLPKNGYKGMQRKRQATFQNHHNTVTFVFSGLKYFFDKNFLLIFVGEMQHTMKKKVFFILTICALCITSIAHGQNKNYQVTCIGFYNLENFFDTIKSPNTNDVDFTPQGRYTWGTMKYNNKLKNMSHAISKIGGTLAPNGPTVLGVAEVENRQVLEDLVKMPDLSQGHYGIVHYDSPDRRGIDVGFLYNKDHFTVTSSKKYSLLIPQDTAFHTRDQLLVEGLLDGEKFYFIVNHWPSRLGGEAASRPKRVAAATLTKHIADSILAENKQAKIVIMGDLNDDPANVSCSKVLRGKLKKDEVKEGDLYNCDWALFDSGIGSLAYDDKWNLFDQIFVTPALLGQHGPTYTFWKAEIMNLYFLTQQEGRYKGYPLRTHAGNSYLNGYSDHYPSCIYLVKEAKR